MPCPSWGIPATRCKIGSILAQNPKNACSSCYALKGRYNFPVVQKKLEARYQGLFDPLWTPAMVFLVRYFCDEYFRWFDSGDLQSESHLRNIVTVAESTPEIRHWLPTREYDMVKAVGEFPENLLVRVSAHKIDGQAPRFAHTSVVTTEVTDAFDCPSRNQGGGCGECRACWEPEVKNVAYRLH